MKRTCNQFTAFGREGGKCWPVFFLEEGKKFIFGLPQSKRSLARSSDELFFFSEDG